MLQVKINEKNLNEDIILLNQVSTYKNFCNFERDDIEVIINNHIVPIKFYDLSREKNKESKGNILNSENLKSNYSFYWNFSELGIHNVLIIFKKKLLQCNELFKNCDSIYSIDCSNFDCSQIIDCKLMFSQCTSLKSINLGKLDFALSYDFSSMFHNSNNLEKLDVSYLNTKNSKSFNSMFYHCPKIKEINVSNFKTTNCENIANMFSNCSSLKSIDMLNWDMKNINYIEGLFGGCSNLKNIKMNFNNNKAKCSKNLYIFYGLPEGGSFIWKKGTDCNRILELLPASWNWTQE